MLLTLAVQKRAAEFDYRDMMTCSPKSRETFDVPLTVVAVFARINCGGNSKAAGAVILFVFNSKAAKREDSNVGRIQEMREARKGCRTGNLRSTLRGRRRD